MEATDRTETEYELAAALLLLWIIFDGSRSSGPVSIQVFMDGFNRLVRPTLTRIYGRARAALADAHGQPYPTRPTASGDGQVVLIPGINNRIDRYAAELYETFQRRQAAHEERARQLPTIPLPDDEPDAPPEESPPAFTEADAERIAVTETTRIHSDGEMDGAKDVESRSGKRMVATWFTEPGACDRCGPLEGTIREWRLVFPSGPPAHPNCFNKAVDVLTERGWVPIAEVEIGDRCWSMDPKTRSQEFVSVQVRVSHYAKYLTRISGTVFFLEVTDEHNMLFASDTESELQLQPLTCMPATGVIPVSKSGLTHVTIQSLRRHRVPYDGVVYCVELAKYHTLFVRQNGLTTWTGNCRCHLEWREFLG